MGLANLDISNDVKAYCNKFNRASSAFILKPNDLRKWDTTVSHDVDQDPNNGMNTAASQEVQDQVGSSSVAVLTQVVGGNN